MTRGVHLNTDDSAERFQKAKLSSVPHPQFRLSLEKQETVMEKMQRMTQPT